MKFKSVAREKINLNIEKHYIFAACVYDDSGNKLNDSIVDSSLKTHHLKLIT
jgi:hypothetical protein